MVVQFESQPAEHFSYFDENMVMDETCAGFQCQDLHRYCDLWIAADYCDLPDEGEKYFKGGETIRESCPKGCGVCLLWTM